MNTNMNKKFLSVAFISASILTACADNNSPKASYSACQNMEDYIETVKNNDPQQYEVLVRLYRQAIEDELHIKNPMMMAGIVMTKDVYHVGEEVEGDLYMLVRGENMRFVSTNFEPIQNGHISFKAAQAGTDTIKGSVVIESESHVERHYPLIRIVKIEE